LAKLAVNRTLTVSIRILFVLGLIGAGALAGCGAENDPDQRAVSGQPGVVIGDSESDAAVSRAADALPGESESAKAARAARDSSSSSRPAPPPSDESAAEDDSFEDSPVDLIAGLLVLDWDEEAGTNEESIYLLEQLLEHGSEAVAPIRDFLLESRESAYVAPELRQALLDVLLSIESPQVEEAALHLLASGPAVHELVQLGVYLEWAEPGKYSDSILLSAEQALINADPERVLPGEFFQLLGEIGTEETALILAAMPWHHGAYARIALANLPDGGGLAPLEREVRDLAAGGRYTMQARLSIELLAQMAPRNPEAAATLIDLAERGAIPNDEWPNVLDILAGNWELTLLEPPPGQLVDSHTFFGQQGNQVIYRAAVPAYRVNDGLHAQRLFLLNRLQPIAPPGLRIPILDP
jgi:hypothetical protein